MESSFIRTQPTKIRFAASAWLLDTATDLLTSIGLKVTPWLTTEIQENEKKIIWPPQFPPEGKNGQPGRAGGGIGSSYLASRFGCSILQCDPVGQHFSLLGQHFWLLWQHFFASWATFLASLATFFRFAKLACCTKLINNVFIPR